MINSPSAEESSLNWYEYLDPVTKLLLIVVFTMLSFIFNNLVAEIVLIVATLGLLIFSKKSNSIFKAIGFSLFFIITMLLIQGLFWPSNKTVAFSFLGLNFYQEGLSHALLLGSRILVIIFSTYFFIETTTLSENSKYLENMGLSYKTVYVLMSVCYILPEMTQNLKKIQLAQKARGISQSKSVIARAKTIMPILVPLVIKTFDQSMSRSISLQLRGYDSNKRRTPRLQKEYWMARFNHYALSLISLVLIGGKIWLLIKK